jgi:hypothetical protein
MSGGKDKGKTPERHSTRKGAGTINKLTYSKPGTNGGTRLSMPRTTTTGEAVVISSDEEDDTTSAVGAPTGGTSPVAAGGGWGGLAFPPSPPMAAVGGSSGAVRARVAELNAATGAVATRTRPLFVRTRVVEEGVDAETQTDDMVLWSCHSCSQKK